MTAKRASMGRYRPKDPEFDQQLADWFSDQRTQGKVVIFVFHLAFNMDLNCQNSDHFYVYIH